MADRKKDLKTLARPPKSLKDEIDSLSEQAWGLRHRDSAKALSLSLKAEKRSTTGKFSKQPYRQGQAAGLLTQGFVNHQLGKLDIALSQCFEALGYLELLPPTRVTIDTYRVISWIYYFLGDIPNALSFGLEALRLAQNLGLRIQEAAVLDGLATTYTTAGDLPQAIVSQEKALAIAREAADRVLESIILNNLSLNLLEMNRSSDALSAAQKSLQIVRELALPEKEVTTIDTLGQILLRTHDFEGAERVVTEGLEIAKRNGLSLAETYCLLNLGKISRAKKDLTMAVSYFQKSLELATAISARALKIDCHRELSESYEMQGNLQATIQQYKLFFKETEEIRSEVSEKRLATLKVAHQVETAQRDGEIYRLQNIELKREIEERTRMEGELVKLATVDSLTHLLNRAHFYKIAERDFERARRYLVPLTVVMIDIDHFKEINDSYGHHVGDQVLAKVAQLISASLRNIDILGRIGGEEFCIAMPDTNPGQGIIACERICSKLAKASIDTTAGSIKVSISVGIAGISQADREPEGKLDQLIERADQAMYRAKRSGRNRIEIYT